MIIIRKRGTDLWGRQGCRNLSSDTDRDGIKVTVAADEGDERRTGGTREKSSGEEMVAW